MNPKVSGAFIFIIALATFVTGALAYPRVDSFAIAFGVPMVLFVLWGLWALLPVIDPIAKGFHGFRYIYDFIWILIVATLAYSYALKLGSALGLGVDVIHAVVPVVAMLFFSVGALLPYIRRNWFFGIRTPWTLSSDEDWAKTHRLGRPLFMVASVFMFIGAFTSRDWSVGLLVVPILLATVTSVVYSYLVFRRRSGHK
jgi:uncharacterized membrane protein